MNTDTIHQEFRVEFSYSVSFTRGVFNADNTLLADAVGEAVHGRPRRVIVYIDDGVAEAHPQLVQRIRNYMARHSDRLELAADPATVPGGESAKNGWNVVSNIMSDIGDAHIDRHSYVLAIGGGSVLDSVGFAASIVHRGVRLIRIPTTVLGQNDAGVGVKTGMDEHGMKNFVGTFTPPHAVLVDFDFLPTLKDKYWFGGISEAFKVAIIKDAAFFRYLEASAGALRKRDEEAIAAVVRRTAELHLEHIRTSGDPFEFGTARPLDFGHWAAHKLEVLSNYRLGHGQAVAIGIALDSRYAALRGMLTPEEADGIEAALLDVGLPIWDPLLDATSSAGKPEVLAGLEEFREHLGGDLTITLPRRIGVGVEVHEMDEQMILMAAAHLKSVCSHSGRGRAVLASTAGGNHA